MVDIARPASVARAKKIRRFVYGGAAVVVLLLITLGLSRLKPAAPPVDRSTVWIDTVKRGDMVRQVRGLGTLVPETTRWITPTTDGIVEKIVLRPPAQVQPDSIILVLTNPQVEQEAKNAELALASAEAALTNLRVTLQNELYAQESQLATVHADYTEAKLLYEMREALKKDNLVSDIDLRSAKTRAEALQKREEIVQKQLNSIADSTKARLAVQQAAVDQTKSQLDLQRRRLSDLQVRAGVRGVLQIVPVEVGQRIGPATNLARVADPTLLKAELKIAETLAKDVQLGQIAAIDTRNGIIAGRVSRIDPSVTGGTRTVDVSLDGDLPGYAVPDMSVDGTIELERLTNVLFVGRPAFGQENSTVGLFKLEPNSTDATQTQVKLGRSSVNTIEILSGLKENEQVILSDMSAQDGFQRIRLR